MSALPPTPHAHTAAHDADAPLPSGRIDIHSHLIPGIDDGCIDLEESLQAIEMLRGAGYVGTVCTPHVWDANYPENSPQQVVAWGAELNEALTARGIDYQVWTGGEVRIRPGIQQWLQDFGVPTLANSRCVLTDFWDAEWEDWIDEVYQWLLLQGYKPILAHPERVMCCRDQPDRLKRLKSMGVLMQGNCRSLTGEEGHSAADAVRAWLDEGLYHIMALDMHRTQTLGSRLDGLSMLESEYGSERAAQLTERAPRQWVFH